MSYAGKPDLYDGPYSFDDEFEDDFNDNYSDETLDDMDEDSESYEEAFNDEDDDIYEPFDDVEPEDGYTNPYKYGYDDFIDEEESFDDEDEE